MASRPINGLKRYFPYGERQISTRTATNAPAERHALGRVPD